MAAPGRPASRSHSWPGPRRRLTEAGALARGLRSHWTSGPQGPRVAGACKAPGTDPACHERGCACWHSRPGPRRGGGPGSPATPLRCLPHLSVASQRPTLMSGALVPFAHLKKSSCKPLRRVPALRHQHRGPAGRSAPVLASLSGPSVNCPQWRKTFHVCSRLAPGIASDSGQGSWPALLKLGTVVKFPQREPCGSGGRYRLTLGSCYRDRASSTHLLREVTSEQWSQSSQAWRSVRPPEAPSATSFILSGGN